MANSTSTNIGNGVSASLNAKLQTADPITNRSAVIALTGREGSGKTGFALSSALLSAGLCVYVEMDRQPKGDYINDMFSTGRVLKPKMKYKNTGKAFDKDFASKAWDELSKLTYECLQDKGIYTIIWDTATYGWELLRMAKFGKLTQVMPHHYGPVNDEFQALFYTAEEQGKLFVALHSMSKEYKAGKEGKEVWNGYYKPSGFSHMDFVANIRLEQHKNDEGQFVCRVVQNKLKPEMDKQDLVGDECQMSVLLHKTFGGDLEDYIDV